MKKYSHPRAVVFYSGVFALLASLALLSASAVADALAAAIASQQARERGARKRKQEDAEAARRHEEEAVMSTLGVELRALCATDPDMSLLTAVEYITPDPAHRIALYRYCHAEDQSIGGARDLALLERRARAEGFQV